MKKIILASLLTSYALSGLAYAQRDPVKTESEIKAEMESIISKIEAHKDNPSTLNQAIRLLEDNRYYHLASPEVRSDVTRRLVKVYNSIDDAPCKSCKSGASKDDKYEDCLVECANSGETNPLTSSANKQRIIEIVGLRSKVPEAHEFYLSVLEKEKELYRKQAIRTIYFGGIPGDDIYDKVKSLVARGVIKEENSLSALKGANPKRALPEVQKFLATTKNPNKYVGIGQLLCFYEDPNLLDVLVERYDYFKNIPLSERPENYAPQFAFSMEMLKKYIEVKEGSKLEKALEIFDARGVFGDRKMPLLQKKLESKDSVTRKAAVKFLIHQAEIGLVSPENVSPVLKNAEARETDKDLKLKLKAALKKLEPPTGGRK